MNQTDDAPDMSHDFDFLFGRWKIKNRRLRARLKGSTDWDEFEATATTRPIWGGAANLEEWEGIGPSGPIVGTALRLYNPRSRQWSIHWGTRATGTLEVPVIGEFRDGRGLFFSQELFEGRTIFVRISWSEITPASCRWEQAFSPDGGETWETNWIMEFTRIATAAQVTP